MIKNIACTGSSVTVFISSASVVPLPGPIDHACRSLETAAACGMNVDASGEVAVLWARCER
jgi:hypothetical protein